MLAVRTEAKLQGEDGMAPYREVITAPAAWTNRSVGGKEAAACFGRLRRGELM